MTSVQEEPADPISEGFREPPDYVTEPCLTYIARIMELRRFIAFHFNFAKMSKELSKLIPQSEMPGLGDKEHAVVWYDFSSQRPLVNQILLSRAAESFDLYMITVLREIFLARPEILKSSGTVDVATIIETGNYGDLIGKVVERMVHELSYKPLLELRRFIESRTGIDPYPSEEAFQLTVVATELRNLIAHNDCVMNDLFRSRTRGIPLNLELSAAGRVTINDQWLRRASYTLDGLVFRFDELASAKFELKTSHRVSSFVSRG